MAQIDTSKLSAVNTMLSLIGEAPVTSLTERITADVSIAINTLDEASAYLQTRGWHWNTDEQVTINARTDGKFDWGADWIRFDTLPGRYSDIDVVRRGDYLYDRYNSTDIFTQDALEGVVVRFLDWESLPQAARNYIMIRAARQFMVRTIGEETRAGYAMEDERKAMHALEDEESEQTSANILDKGWAPLAARRNGNGLSFGNSGILGDNRY